MAYGLDDSAWVVGYHRPTMTSTLTQHVVMYPAGAEGVGGIWSSATDGLNSAIPALTLGAGAATYIPIMIIITMAVTFAVANLVLTKLLGPSRDGSVKGGAYESGMNPVGSARKRFNVRFYLIAMVFLLFDIEIIFLYPWAVTFTNLQPGSPDALEWLARILFFLFTTVVAYIYGLRKGVFRFD